MPTFSSKKTAGGTLLEVITVLAIVALGVVSAFNIIGSGRNLSNHTENTIKAINIARDGIEGMIVIRNTNWVKFSSDRTNCWNSLNYTSACIGVPFPQASNDPHIGTGSYVIYNSNGVWMLSGVIADNIAPEDSRTNWTQYANKYKVFIDTEGYATQSGSYNASCTTSASSNCVSKFSRELYVSYTQTGIMNVASIVKWTDPAYTGAGMYKEVTLKTELTNWKSKF